MVLRGKWAQGIEPRNFTWILQDKLAVCERPGGYGANHRKVRRQEEIIWLREQGFTLIVSVAASPHNLHNYDEMDMPWIHRPFRPGGDREAYLASLFPQLRQLLLDGGKLVMHQDELGDSLAGLMAAYVLWNRLVPAGPQAISVVEQLLHRQLGPTARSLVALASRLPEPGSVPVEPIVPDTLDEVADGADDEGGGDGVISVRGLRVLCHVGVPEAERATRQPIEVDLDLEVDLTRAAESDEVADTADYGVVTDAVAAALEAGPHRLLERLAGLAADAALGAAPQATAVTVSVTKLRPPVPRDVATAAVRLHRSRS